MKQNSKTYCTPVLKVVAFTAHDCVRLHLAPNPHVPQSCDDAMTEFSDWLKGQLEEMEGPGDGYHAVARAVGVSPTTVRSWASGFTKTPGWENLKKLANALGVDEKVVLEKAGYEGVAGDAEAEPTEIIEVRAIARELYERDQPGLASLLVVARALRDSRRAQGRRRG